MKRWRMRLLCLTLLAGRGQGGASSAQTSQPERHGLLPLVCEMMNVGSVRQMFDPETAVLTRSS